MIKLINLINYIREKTNERTSYSTLKHRKTFREQIDTKDLLFFYGLIYK